MAVRQSRRLLGDLGLGGALNKGDDSTGVSPCEHQIHVWHLQPLAPAPATEGHQRVRDQGCSSSAKPLSIQPEGQSDRCSLHIPYFKA